MVEEPHEASVHPADTQSHRNEQATKSYSTRSLTWQRSIHAVSCSQGCACHRGSLDLIVSIKAQDKVHVKGIIHVFCLSNGVLSSSITIRGHITALHQMSHKRLWFQLYTHIAYSHVWTLDWGALLLTPMCTSVFPAAFYSIHTFWNVLYNLSHNFHRQ